MTCGQEKGNAIWIFFSATFFPRNCTVCRSDHFPPMLPVLCLLFSNFHLLHVLPQLIPPPFLGSTSQSIAFHLHLISHSDVLLCFPYYVSNHLILAPLAFSDILCTPHLWISSLFILSLRLTPVIHLSILISVLSSILSSFAPIIHISAPYNKLGLIIVLYTLAFNFNGIFLSQVTPVSSLHLHQATSIRSFTASVHPPLLHVTLPRYLNFCFWASRQCDLNILRKTDLSMPQLAW